MNSRAALTTLFALVVCFNGKALSTGPQIGGRIGMNISSATITDPKYPSFKSIDDVQQELGYSVGVVIRQEFTDAIRLNGWISYDQRHLSVTPAPTIDGSSLRAAKFDYISLVPTIQYVTEAHVIANVGFSLGFMTQAKGEYSGGYGQYESSLHYANLLRFGIVFGIGTEFELDGLSVSPEVSYDLGLTKAEDTDDYQTFRISSLQLSLSVVP